MDTVHLIGAEEVGRAGHNMRDAASTMRDAASTIDSALASHHLFMDRWLLDLERVLREHRDA